MNTGILHHTLQHSDIGYLMITRCSPSRRP